MAKIFRTSDRIPVKIDTLTVYISPLSFDQKIELQTIMIGAKDPMQAVRGARLAVKYAVKSVEGIEDAAGTPYQVTLGEDGLITDECVDDLLNMEEQPKLITLCAQLISGVPKDIMDPQTGKPLAGVSVEPPSRKGKARK